jgi:hypothetical protein
MVLWMWQTNDSDVIQSIGRLACGGDPNRDLTLLWLRRP